MAENNAPPMDAATPRIRHLRLGWALILIFGALGLFLEVLHGFKFSWYLDVGNETQRTLLRLGHAHGTLLGLINIGFAATVADLTARGTDAARPGKNLRAASVLLPGGFILGGLFPFDGDPGLGILLVPAGALCLLLTAWSVFRGLGR
jgi:hypothetical protein